ncbi:hypothetical protein Sbal625DRAFT_3483 [Shewanella baltica OS625]|nr:hypothetical protein Sbal678_2469 [Shewanella baltica OS678]EHC04923.1 hypothetical protein Sbal625DRAFT_3483 [Shewanella baltica OS625]SUI55965.1 Uncharacterised protein [Shewanella baltica]
MTTDLSEMRISIYVVLKFHAVLKECILNRVRHVIYPHQNSQWTST